jgi:uncharacterized phage protein gp47/JayE
MQTKDAIHKRMLDASPADIDKRPGSITYDLLGPAAIELESVYMELSAVLDKGFADTSYGEYLDRRVAELGITRKPAVKAVGSVVFTGTDGTVIPIGTEVYTNDENPVYFVTTSDGTITNGSVTVAAQAKEGGVRGNVAAGKITLTSGNITGITSVTNPQAFDGGVDAESDADLLARYLDRVRTPATSGNAAAYRQWALERPGVGDAKVYPLWNGNGTVKVVLIDSERTTPTQAVIDDVAAYIESVRPIGATVSVVGATELPINVSATLTLESGYTVVGVQPTIEAGIVEYLKSIAFKNEPVRLSRIANIILDTEGVTDYANLTINGETGNITVPDDQVAVKGTVTFT